ncbi:hypothetical protein BDW59DRAFT_18164 [Aspergillus cavernicola]|uniref:Fungal-specific transcription factor domain-containing protein n=1 Tax=Aspergillus cavernicola TaxID=176166 RepID=A0ABR4IRV6_9EURO
MPPKSKNNGPPRQFLFVGGPTLNPQSGNVRSTLLRRVLDEKRAKRRQDAADKLDSMLKKDAKAVPCSCPGQSVLADSLEAASRRMIRPRNHNGGGLSDRCPTCGGFLPALTASRGDRTMLAPSPQLLGAGRSDPLLPVDATAARLKVHELLDFTANTIWPHFRPLDYAGNCYKDWVFPVENNLLYYAVLWSASYHRDILRITHGASQPQLDAKEQLELKELALQALQKEVANVSETTSPDALVMCILYLAVNDKHKSKISRDPSPFSPPFINLQALDFYGSRDYHSLHWTVVQDIVRRFGGIHSLRAFALAWLLSLSDLMSAVQMLSKPIYSIVGLDAQPLRLQPPSLLFQPHGHHDTLDDPGSGFHDLVYIWPPIKQDIVPIFVHLGQFSGVLQHYSGETCSPVVLSLLGDSRNLVHHRLLSLPDENDPLELILECKDQAAEENELSREIYLTCRLSAILYAVHVTFPVPRTQLLRESILQSLCPRFDRLSTQNVSRPLLVWCVAVTISALGDESPEPLMAYMARLLQDAEVDTVPKLLALLRSFAWVDAAVQESWEGRWTRITSEAA